MHDLRWTVGLMVALACALAWGTPAQAKTQRLLLGPASATGDPQVSLVTSYLARRLGECDGVALAGAARALRLAAYVTSPAWIASDADRWAWFSRQIDLDGLLLIHAIGEGRPGGVRVTILRSGETRTIEADLRTERGDPSAAERVGRLARQVGVALGLGEADLDRLSEVRAVEAFEVIEQIMAAPVARSHALAGSWASALEAGDDGKRSVDYSHAALRAAHATVTAEMRNRSPSLIRRAYLIGRTGVFDVMGTPHEPLAYPFVRMESDDYTQGLIREMKALLRDSAQPLRFGPTLDGAGGEIDGLFDLDDLEGGNGGNGGSGDMLDDVAANPQPTLVSTRTGRTSFTADQQRGALRLVGLMADAEALELIEAAAARDDPATRQAAAFALRGYAGEVGMQRLAALVEDKDPQVAFVAGESLAARGEAPARLAAMAQRIVDDPAAPADLTQRALRVLIERARTAEQLEGYAQRARGELGDQVNRMMLDRGWASPELLAG